MSKCIIRRAEDGDIEGIARLRCRIKEFEPVEIGEYIEFWVNWVKENPLSKQLVYVAVIDQHIIVGHYALIPYTFLMNGTRLIGGFVGQLMVDERFRNKLIFPNMLLKMLRGYKDVGVDFVYSLSSRGKVVKAHQSFGFRTIGVLSVYAKPCRLRTIVPHLIQNKLLKMVLSPVLSVADKVIHLTGVNGEKQLNIIEITRFDTAINKFIANVQHHFSYCILRNAAILNWLTVDTRGRNYRILLVEEKGETAGYIIIRRMKMKQFDVLAIVDILFSPDKPDVGKALLKKVYRMGLEMKVDMTSCLLSVHDPLFPILRKCGYYKTPETIELFAHTPRNTELHLSQDTFEKWHITWLDHDTV